MPKVTVEEDEKTGAIRITCSLVEDTMNIVKDEEAIVIRLPETNEQIQLCKSSEKH